MVTTITFNENTYRFDYFQGKNEKANLTFDCYGIYKNGELNSDYLLEEYGTIESGEVVEKLFFLYYKGFNTTIFIKDFSILEVAKVIDYINKNK